MKIRSYLAAACLVHSHSLLVADASTEAAASAGVSAALKSLDYRYFVAGGTCAAISHGITTPIDVVKTKIQADPAKYNKGMRQAALDIMKTDGPAALLGGLGPTVVGYGIEGAMKFGVYEVMKPVFTSLFGQDSKAVAFLLASIVAGAVAAVLLCPMESTRIKIVTDPSYSKDNLLTALAKLAATEGLGSSFSGLWAMLAKQVPYTFGKQVSFDVFAGLLYTMFHALQERNAPLVTESSTKWAVSVFAAAAASLIACIFSQPGDMILTETYRPQKQKPAVAAKPAFVSSTDKTLLSSVDADTSAMQEQKDIEVTFMPSSASTGTNSEASIQTSTTASTAQAEGGVPPSVASTAVSVSEADNDVTSRTSTAIFDVVSRLYAEGGIAKFFTGTQARIVHVGLIITSQLVIYDIVKQLLGLPATGSH